MIRKLILLSLSLGAIAHATAQHASHNLFHLSPGQVKNWKMVNNFLQSKSKPDLAHKPTGIKQRVVAQVTFDGEYVDSVIYKYSGTNGSDYDYGNIIDGGYSYEFAPDLAPAYMQNDYSPSTNVMADTIISYDNDGAYYQERAYYNVSGKIDSIRGNDMGSLSPDYYRTVVGYDAEGYVETFDERYNSVELFDMPNNLRVMSYSSSGQVETDTSSYYDGTGWVNTDIYGYHYNGDSKLDTLFNFGSSPEQLVFTYNGDGKISTIKGYRITGGGPELYMIDSFGYTAGVDYVTHYEEEYILSGEPLYGTRIIQYPGTSGKPDSLVLYEFDDEGVWSKLAAAEYSYNSFGNPETISIAGGGEDGLNGYARFYYEEYDDGLSLDDADKKGSFNIYPNPFMNNITIDYKGKEAKGPVSVSMTDITGRMVFNASIDMKQGNNNIAIPELAAGNYILLLSDASGKSWSSKLVKK